MMVKGFGAWKATIRLQTKRFYTTKTRSRPNEAQASKIRKGSSAALGMKKVADPRPRKPCPFW
jgi:hypothetical protein